MSLLEFLTRLSKHRLLWRAFLVLVVLIPFLLLLPHMQSLVVRNAVVTAYLNEIRAPIEGDVEDVFVVPGQTAPPHAQVIVIRNSRADRSRIARLEAQLKEAADEVQASARALNWVRESLAARRTELELYTEPLTQSPRRRGQASNEQVDGAQSDALVARADHATNRPQSERLAGDHQRVGQSSVHPEIAGRALLSQQLVQDLEIQALRLEERLRDRDAHRDTVEAELTSAVSAFGEQTEASIAMSSEITIWDVDVVPGMAVTKGQTLFSYVDCSSLLVDIAVDDATLELVATGLPVRMRIFGRPEEVDGKVVLVRGSAGVKGAERLAATVQERGPRDGQVLAQIDQEELDRFGERTCDIGRSSYVEFEDIGFFEQVIDPLLW